MADTSTPSSSPAPRVLVTGATGYIGGRLIPELLAAGYRVRAMARHPEALSNRDWAGNVEIVKADATCEDSLREALHGCDVAYYLLHSMGGGADFAEKDRYMARTFGKICREESVGRIIYLGGLIPPEDDLSPHMQSRKEVGDILLDSGVPTIVLRAAVILGSGSASFEMMRYLTERLPAMIAPKWITNRVQPIAVRDVLAYLVGCASLDASVHRSFDIGGPDVLRYIDMIQEYARVAGLPPRKIVPLPVLTPGLASHWINIVTPVPGAVAKPLVHSVIHEVVCRNNDIDQHVRIDNKLSFGEAVELALTRYRDHDVPTAFSSAYGRAASAAPMPDDPDWAGGDIYTDEREIDVDASPEALWSVLQSIGGDKGWYSWGLSWQVRGILDRLVGGPGLRRGRVHPNRLNIGDPVDWWRVEQIIPQALIRLRAEMRLPGKAWLDLEVRQGPAGQTRFGQRAVFEPRGLAGRAYWYSVLPFHGIVFASMQENIAKAARALEAGEVSSARELDPAAVAALDNDTAPSDGSRSVSPRG